MKKIEGYWFLYIPILVGLGCWLYKINPVSFMDIAILLLIIIVILWAIICLLSTVAYLHDRFDHDTYKDYINSHSSIMGKLEYVNVIALTIEFIIFIHKYFQKHFTINLVKDERDKR